MEKRVQPSSTERKRVQPSAIDMLPIEAEPDVRWAAAEVLDGRRYNTDILAEFNERLARKGLGPISSSGFGRHALWVREMAAEQAEMRELSKAVVERLGPDVADDATKMLIDMVKTSVLRIMRRDRDTMAASDLKSLAQALNSAIAAQTKSAEARRVSEDEMRRRMQKATEAAADGLVASNPGLDKASVMKRIQQDVYQIFDEE